ncbi:MAG: LysR substrate-binding domain-containing protein [Myxococcota bacterium]
MDFRHLRALQVLSEELHFGRAAKRLGVVQSGLSRTLQGLEDEVGVPLVERTSRRVRITRAGETFLEHARVSLESAEDAVRAARSDGGGEFGRLRLGVAKGAAQPAFGTLLARFRERHPGVALSLRRLDESGLSATLSDGALDAVVCWSGAAPSTCQRRPVATADLHVLLPATDPLSEAAGVPLRALAGRPMVVPAKASSPLAFERFSEACRDAGFELDAAMDADSIEDMLALVSSGAWMACAPLPEGFAYPGVTARPLLPRFELRYELVWLTTSRASNRWVEALADLTASSARS